MTTIDVLCNDGSPLGVMESSIYGNDGTFGVGGAELALLTMCRAWKDAGYYVRLYNDPRRTPPESCFEQLRIDEFRPDDPRDILVIFRSPNLRSLNAKGKKIWWSCDQYTIGDFAEFSRTVDEIVVISPFHANYFRERYGITKVKVIDLPVREWDYSGLSVEKVPNQVLFSSVPDRGLIQMESVWAKITEKVPHAKLVITSDWRLWSPNIPASIISQYRLRFARFGNVEYRALLPRSEFVKVQAESYLHVYPCIYDELFCIAVAESQYVGCLPITSSCGALESTNMGIKSHNGAMSVEGQNELADYAIDALLNPNKYASMIKKNHIQAKHRFSIERAVKAWTQNVFC